MAGNVQGFGQVWHLMLVQPETSAQIVINVKVNCFGSIEFRQAGTKVELYSVADCYSVTPHLHKTSCWRFVLFSKL